MNTSKIGLSLLDHRIPRIMGEVFPSGYAHEHCCNSKARATCGESTETEQRLKIMGKTDKKFESWSGSDALAAQRSSENIT